MEKIDEFELYKIAYKQNLIKELNNLEIPEEWNGKDVMKFISSKIERSL